MPARLVALVGLLLVEFAGLTLRFSVRTLPATDAWWSRLVRATGDAAPILILSATALLVLGGSRLAADLKRATACPHPTFRAWLVLHLLLVALFTLLTWHVIEGGVDRDAVPELAVFAWLGSGLAAAGSWLVAVMPPAVLGRLVSSQPGLWLVAAGIGLGGSLAGGVTEGLWDPLGDATLTIVHHQMRWLTDTVVYEPAERLIGTQAFAVILVFPCSGYEGIGLMWVFLSGYLWFFRHTLRFPHALLLLPIGTVLIWLANTLRLTALIAIGTWVSPEFAMAGFHTRAGWIFLCLVALGVVALTQRFGVFAAPSRAEIETANPTAAHISPFLGVVAVAFLTATLSHRPELWYPLQVVAGIALLVFFRRQLPTPSFPVAASAIAMGVLAFAAWIGLVALLEVPRAGSLPPSVLALSAPARLAWLAIRIAGAVIVVPVVEELAFRSFLLRRLVSADFERVPPTRFAWFPFLASSVVYGLLHERWQAGIVAGMLYALAVQRRGRLSDAILAHAVTNALLVAWALATDQWAVWT